VLFRSCDNGLDDDGDGLTDYPADPDCFDLWSTERGGGGGLVVECRNGIDDDEDGFADFPADPGCLSPGDRTEADDGNVVCGNGLDDDGDGLTDWEGGDPGCLAASDTSERERTGPACDNGVDDDMDGLTDYPADDYCQDAWDQFERPPQCDNGVDDDEDGLTDWMEDPGCDGSQDDDERSACEGAPDVGLGPAVSEGNTCEADTPDFPVWCGANGSPLNYVFRFTAPEDATYTFDTFGSSYDTVLAAGWGCGADWCNDDSYDPDWWVQSYLEIWLWEGDSIYVSVEGYAGSCGDYVLNIGQM
jgi:hypothetical protein